MPLAFAAGQRAQRLAEREVVQPDVVHRLQLADDLLALREEAAAPRATVIASTSLIDLPSSL